IPQKIQEWLLTREFPNRVVWLKEQLGKLDLAVLKYSALWAEFVTFTDLDLVKWYSEAAGDWESFRLDLLRSRLSRAIDAAPSLSEWLEYLRAAKELMDAMLGSLVSLAEQGNLKHSQLRDAYEFSVFNGLCNLVVKTHPKLLSFSRNRHEKVREEFARL